PSHHVPSGDQPLHPISEGPAAARRGLPHRALSEIPQRAWRDVLSGGALSGCGATLRITSPVSCLHAGTTQPSGKTPPQRDGNNTEPGCEHELGKGLRGKAARLAAAGPSETSPPGPAPRSAARWGERGEAEGG